MSADNWAVCPRCIQKQDNWRLVLGESLRDDDYTLREDYEVGMEANGLFSVVYTANCNKCGFSFMFKHSQVAYEPTRQPKRTTS